MTHKTAQAVSRPILSSTEAQLFVADIKASCDFYANKLGFTVNSVYGDPPYYGQVTRDHARLNTGLRWRYSGARASALCFAHRRYKRRDRTALFELPGRRRALPSNTKAGALGRQHLHRRRSRWKSPSVCRPSQLK
jgi:catechol 2,3-dioxygenase-like lactoylglutathione lyase family enzyme